MVALIVGAEYWVFCSEHLLPAMARAGGDTLALMARLLEAAVFHALLGCLLVSYAKVVLTGELALA